MCTVSLIYPNRVGRLQNDRSARCRAAAARAVGAAAAGLNSEYAVEWGVERLVSALEVELGRDEIVAGVGQGMASLFPAGTASGSMAGQGGSKDPLLTALRYSRATPRLLGRFPYASTEDLLEV